MITWIRFRLLVALSFADSPPAGVPETQTPAHIARAIADALEHHEIPYAIGGALALGFYAPPRATLDVDINAFIPLETGLGALLTALGQAGFIPHGSSEEIRAAANQDGQFRGEIEGIRVDVFVPVIPYYGELEISRRQITLLGRPIWILGPEDLAVLKLMFFRRKDLADVEAILRDQGSALDRSYIRRRLVEFVGQDDERVATLADIERDVNSV